MVTAVIPGLNQSSMNVDAFLIFTGLLVISKCETRRLLFFFVLLLLFVMTKPLSVATCSRLLESWRLGFPQNFGKRLPMTNSRSEMIAFRKLATSPFVRMVDPLFIFVQRFLFVFVDFLWILAFLSLFVLRLMIHGSIRVKCFLEYSFRFHRCLWDVYGRLLTLKYCGVYSWRLADYCPDLLFIILSFT